MASEIIPAPLGELRAASTAGGGTALTTTAALIQLLEGTKVLYMTPRNFAGCEVVKFALNPYLIVLRTTDDLATIANMTDYSSQAQDGDTATAVVVSSMNTKANGDCLYVGSHLPFRGWISMSTARTASPTPLRSSTGRMTP